MKIIVTTWAVSPKGLSDGVLRWAPRAGFEFKLCIPGGKRKAFKEEIDDANYHWYAGIDYSCIESRLTPEQYARKHGAHLLVRIPPKLLSWYKSKAYQEDEIAPFVEAMGKARLAFGKSPSLKHKEWRNGVTMDRVE